MSLINHLVDHLPWIIVVRIRNIVYLTGKSKNFKEVFILSIAPVIKVGYAMGLITD